MLGKNVLFHISYPTKFWRLRFSISYQYFLTRIETHGKRCWSEIIENLTSKSSSDIQFLTNVSYSVFRCLVRNILFNNSYRSKMLEVRYSISYQLSYRVIRCLVRQHFLPDKMLDVRFSISYQLFLPCISRLGKKLFSSTFSYPTKLLWW